MNPTNVTASSATSTTSTPKRRSSKTTSTSRAVSKSTSATSSTGTTRTRKTSTSTKTRSKKAQASTQSSVATVENPSVANATTVFTAEPVAAQATAQVSAVTPAEAPVEAAAEATPALAEPGTATSGFFSASRASAAHATRSPFIKPDSKETESASSFAQNPVKVFSEVSAPRTSMVSNAVPVEVAMPSYEIDLDELDAEIEQFRAERAKFDERFNLSFVRGNSGTARNSRRK